MAFDVLALDDESLLGLPWTKRRAVLDGLGLDGHRAVPTMVPDDGDARFAERHGTLVGDVVRLPPAVEVRVEYLEQSVTGLLREAIARELRPATSAARGPASASTPTASPPCAPARAATATDLVG